MICNSTSRGEPTASDSVRLTDERSCRTRELPNQIPPSAINKLISRCTSDWTTLSSDLLDDVCPVVEVLLDRLIETTFGGYTHGGLSTAVS